MMRIKKELTILNIIRIINQTGISKIIKTEYVLKHGFFLIQKHPIFIRFDFGWIWDVFLMG